jgi:peptidoglycan/xylan/chitin deacetylase (PgdA/CDA1 family)
MHQQHSQRHVLATQHGDPVGGGASRYPFNALLSILMMTNARRLAEASLIWCGVDRWAARGRRGRCLVLAYHNIIPDDAPIAGDQSLHLPRHRFADQLDALVESCDVLPLTAVLRERSPHARPAVAITFDDAYQGALTLGAGELRARRLPATMFVAPGLLGGHSFWWDALAGPAGLPDMLRDHVLVALRGDDDATREWADRSGHVMRAMPPWGRSGTESELASWAADGSLSIGVHTWRHANLSRLSTSEVESELAKPLVWLRERLSAVTIPWLTYPYGMANSEVTRTVEGVGYDAALMAAGGWLPRPPRNRFALSRLNVASGLTAAGFRLRLAGLFGAVAPAQQSGADLLQPDA